MFNKSTFLSVFLIEKNEANYEKTMEYQILNFYAKIILLTTS